MNVAPASSSLTPLAKVELPSFSHVLMQPLDSTGSTVVSNSSPAATGAASSAGAPKRAYPAPCATPTQAAEHGIRFDFNDGCRVSVPPNSQPWRIRLTDSDTGNVLFETQISGGWINSTKRYYIRFKIEIWSGTEIAFEHNYSAIDRHILIQFPVGTLGDPLGWLPYAIRFQEKHKCKLTCALGQPIIDLVRNSYPNIEFITHDQVKAERYYATYSIGLFFDDKDCVFQPCDFRHVGLHRTAAYILGVDPTETRPKLAVACDARPIDEPYVCIAVQSTTQSKYWNNPEGWRALVSFLKEAGYRVICIDQKAVHGTGIVWNHIPHGAEDQTGDKPLSERVQYLRHAEFFVGLSSGLSWLAWAAGIPVVMISGFTHPTNEFETPFRIINYHACNSCWNDPRIRFDHHDFLWCPRQKGTSRQFECTRLITVEHVKSAVKAIPGFGQHLANAATINQAKHD